MLTPEERRGALLVVGLILAGAAWDAGRALHPATAPPRTALEAITIAAPESVAAVAPAEAAAVRVAGPGPRVDLNRAGASDLDALPGIGPVLARRILEHRARHGPFRSIEELRAVRGVGPSLVARLRDRVRFGP